MTKSTVLTRRHTVLGASALTLAACEASTRGFDGATAASGGGAAAGPTGGGSATGGGSGAGFDAGAVNDAGTADASMASTKPDSGTTDGGTKPFTDAGIVNGWATGGTKSMLGNYVDPFRDVLGAVCGLFRPSDLGPCDAMAPDRQDISEGENGLPVRLALKVVNAKCQPLSSVTVEIWHTNLEGLYSGTDAIDFCTKADQRARASRWFRGIRTSDAQGRVDFDTCFPGWYPGRTIHIHFVVRRKGVPLLTSQLYFDEMLTLEILEKQPGYRDRGVQDTLNARDGLYQQAGASDALVKWQRQADGAMLAWKLLVVSGQ